ncbi:uncharacterized protein [Dysidea avara]|uniref:uncharacterized protein n=1 Tax=Dysidea avara TaxID=196820 RepID=UPI0033312ADD
MLQDRIVCGVNDTVIQRRLLAEKDLDFKKAMEVAQGMESAATNVRKLTDTKQNSKAANDREPIHQIGTKAKNCYRCGNPGQYATTCKYKDTVCHNCGKVGHLQKVCHSKSQQKSASKDKKGFHSVEEKVEVDENPVDEEALFNINTSTDNILISGADEPEHLQILGQVLIRLDNAGLRVKKEKCEFLVPSVTYLGHKIDANGLHPLPEKVKAVEDTPSPQNFHELRTHLGLISYYSKFLPICLLFSHLCTNCYKNQQSGVGQMKLTKHFKIPRSF